MSGYIRGAVVWGLTTVLLSSFLASGAPTSDCEGASRPENVTLTISTIRDRGLQHAQNLEDFIQGDPLHHSILSRVDSVFSVRTNRPDDFLIEGGLNGKLRASIVSVKKDGVDLPLFGEPLTPDFLPLFSKSAQALSSGNGTDREKIYMALSLLPEGIYRLEDADRKAFSLLVGTIPHRPVGEIRLSRSYSDIAVLMDLYRGNSVMSPYETSARERIVTEVDTRLGTVAEDIWVSFGRSDFNCGYRACMGWTEGSLRFGYQSGVLKFIEDEHRAIRYTVIDFLPRKG